MENRKRCVLKAVFEKGYRIFYFEDSVDEMVFVYLNETASKYLMICDKSLIIEVPEDDESDALDKQFGHDYASIGFVRSHQKEYEDIPKGFGYNA